MNEIRLCRYFYAQNESMRIAQNSWLKDYQDCTTIFQIWSKFIFNTFEYLYTTDLLRGIKTRLRFLREMLADTAMLIDLYKEYYIYLTISERQLYKGCNRY